MKKVELISGIQSSVLGFGCAPILGSVGSAKAKIAIDMALDLGVNHFDLARSYGYGEAESFVGNHLRAKRKRLIYASKFGIEANWKASLLKPLKPIIRSIKGKKSAATISNEVSESQVSVNTISDMFHNRIQISAAAMQSNLEKSLKALKTDYIDYYFVHEPLELIQNIDDLILAAEALKKHGKIRAFGLAFAYNQRKLHDDYINAFDVLQFNNSPGTEQYEAVKSERGNASNIFFSPIKGGNSNLKPAEKLLRLNADFKNSVILCSMFNPKHIETNCSVFN